MYCILDTYEILEHGGYYTLVKELVVGNKELSSVVGITVLVIVGLAFLEGVAA